MKITRELCAGASVLGVQNLISNSKFDQPKPFHTLTPAPIPIRFTFNFRVTNLTRHYVKTSPKLAAPPAPEKHGEKLCTLYIIQPTDGTRRHRPFFRGEPDPGEGLCSQHIMKFAPICPVEAFRTTLK